MLTLLLLGMSLIIFAQHEHHKMPAKQDSTAKAKKKTPMAKDTMPMQHMHGEQAINMDTGMHPNGCSHDACILTELTNEPKWFRNRLVT